MIFFKFIDLVNIFRNNRSFKDKQSRHILQNISPNQKKLKKFPNIQDGDQINPSVSKLAISNINWGNVPVITSLLKNIQEREYFKWEVPPAKNKNCNLDSYNSEAIRLDKTRDHYKNDIDNKNAIGIIKKGIFKYKVISENSKVISNPTDFIYRWGYLKEDGVLHLSRNANEPLSGIPIDIRYSTTCISDDLKQKDAFTIETSDSSSFHTKKVYLFVTMDYLNWLKEIASTKESYYMEICEPSSFSNYVPSIVEICVELIDLNLKYEGIYRKGGKKSTIDLLHNQINPSVSKLQVSDINWGNIPVITSLLKKWLKEIPKSLIPFQFEKEITTSLNDDSHQVLLNNIKDILHKLPRYNFETLKYLCEHLRRVCAYQYVNKMTLANISKSVGPSLFSENSKNENETISMNETISSAMKILQSQYSIIELIIIYQDWLFTSKDTVLDIPVELKRDDPDLFGEFFSKRMKRMNNEPIDYTENQIRMNNEPIDYSENQIQCYLENLLKKYKFPTDTTIKCLKNSEIFKEFTHKQHRKCFAR